MRFEVVTAFAIGVLLPVLETIRRGFAHWAIDATTMLEDYLGGGVLIVAGICALRGTLYSGRLLIAAWAAVSGMMTISLISQVEDTLRAVDLEPGNGIVLVVKLGLWLICVTAMARAFGSVKERRG